MTTLTEQLLGARVKSADGKAIGTVEKVYGDNGMPTWAWVRNGRAGRFVPLDRGRLTADRLSIPYDSQQIRRGPATDAGQHLSATQARQLIRYYGLAAPARQPARRPRARLAHKQSLVRQEEQFQVGKETLESGTVRLHRYVDIEPVEQVVRVSHEEYDVERIPVSADEGAHDFSEAEREIILHEEQPVLRKERVPMERVRLTVREIEEEKAVTGEVRRERIEVEPERRAKAGRNRPRR
jgi:uncharacterized protein (TIGR02271 family)